MALVNTPISATYIAGTHEGKFNAVYQFDPVMSKRDREDLVRYSVRQKVAKMLDLPDTAVVIINVQV